MLMPKVRVGRRCDDDECCHPPLWKQLLLAAAPVFVTAWAELFVRSRVAAARDERKAQKKATKAQMAVLEKLENLERLENALRFVEPVAEFGDEDPGDEDDGDDDEEETDEEGRTA